ncbi:MAG TPA: helix-turn-helix transcriptional regulator [Myxococcota bacterium]|nr:helix-turn-helix transcriptional regulator [Myxococcota bacterium]
MSDWIGIVETAYSLDGDFEPWLENVLRAAGGLLGDALSLTATAFRVGAREIELEHVVSVGRDARLEQSVRLAHAFAGPHALDLLLRASPPAATLSEVLGGDSLNLVTALSARGSVFDTRRFVARASAERGIVFGAQLANREQLSSATRERWRRAAFHLGAAYRLRLGLSSARLDDESVEAVLEPGGEIQHATSPAQSKTARECLREVARRADRARGALRRDPDESLGLWEGLVRGRWSLVDHFDSDGRRFIVAHRNDPEGADPRGLAARERDCSELLGRGFSVKEIAYGLGLSAITVSHALARARAKLGFQSQAELAAFFAPNGLRARFAEFALAGLPLAVASYELLDGARLDSLSEAEREIALLLVSGATNTAIATERGTALQTVANQIGSLYAKLGVHSRAELAALLRRVTH